MMKRFWDKVEKTPGGCWEWLAHKGCDGYGTFRNGSMVLAHRYSWELHNGPIPEGLYVCHKCDNPGCVRPAHLFTATQGENIKDCIRKGRRVQARGARNGNSKLTARNVTDIRSMRCHSYVFIASIFKVTPENISAIIRRKTWKHLC